MQWYIALLQRYLNKKKYTCTGRRTLSSPMFISSSLAVIIIYITLQKKACTIEQREFTRSIMFLNIIESIYYIYVPYTVTFPGIRLRISIFHEKFICILSTEVDPLGGRKDTSRYIYWNWTYTRYYFGVSAYQLFTMKSRLRDIREYPAGIRDL